MNKEIETFPLKFEQALRYVTDQLRDGHTLAQKLLKNLDFKKGSFFSILHSPIDKSKIHEFQTGGILAENPLETVSFNGKSYPGRKKANSVQRLAEYLKNVMHAKSCCYFEDLLHRKEDPIAIKFKTTTLYYHGEPYLFLQNAHFSIERAIEMIQYVDAQWHYMNVISEEKPGSTLEMTDEKLEKIASKTSLIVIGAYDMEGFVVWERSN